MGKGKHKDFLNAGILGGGAGVPVGRGFRPISVEYIGSPDYDPEFFETYPTAWASAYAFTKALEAEAAPAENGQQGSRAQQDEPAAAVTEEWVTLFLFHYFGIVHLSSYSRDALERDYDKDLWLALSGTYPSAKGDGMTSIKLLETNEHTVVGAYYPEILFFPSRGRGNWAADKVLSAYLVGGNKLSWELASRHLLTSEQKQREFHEHLLRVSALLPSQTFKQKIQKFCDKHFTEPASATGRPLDTDPLRWDIPGNKPPEPREFLDQYPLQRPSGKGGRIYYLVSGMPHVTPWMTTAIVAGCSPYQYRQTGPHQITVHALGRDIVCDLEDGKDEIVPLKDMFLADPPYWCKVNRAAAAYTSKIRTLHKVELRDPVLKQDEVAVCLAPVRRKFLEHFPEVFKGRIVPTPDVQRPTVEWTFPVPGRAGASYEVRWITTPIGQREMPNTSVALWPPKVSRDWKLYAAYATGSKEACGRWHLVSEKGAQGELVSVEEEEYISILQPLAGSNTPRALLFTDNNDNERGVLFLADLEDRQASGDGAKVTLSVDFGTSNTCLAYKNEGTDNKPATLKFGLSPLMLWGEAPALEVPGFVPFRWGGGKGFFPTVLLSRKTAGRLDEIRPDDIGIDHLFKTDILGLHAGMEDRWLDGRFDTLWEAHSKIKWDLDIKAPWRSLFLGLTLLYAHAELFFSGAQGFKVGKYIFTFPLAFTDTDRREFHNEAKKAIQKIRYFCYGTVPQADSFDFEYSDQIDESTAIAKAARVGGVSTGMEVFVDVGGGTADIAVRNGNDFLVLDSVKVAGNTFFRIAEKNFEEQMVGSETFKKHLARVLQIPEFRERARPRIDLGTLYSIKISGVSEDDFRKSEAKVIQEGMGTNSYQRYRARLLFRHVLAYALLQACSAVVGGKINLNQGIKLILGGNGWGLLLFAELPRQRKALQSEAAEILRLLKEKLREVVAEDEWPLIENLSVAGVELLNEVNLSKAKTDVAVGAINASEDRRAARGGGGKDGTTPYSGLSVNGLSLNDREARVVRWCDRWGFEEFKEKYGFMDAIQTVRFEQPRDLRQPFDPVLSVFTRLGNVSRTDLDKMPGETWRDINAEICEEISLLEGNRLERSPINHFISRVLYPEDQQRDFLDTLAEENGSYKSERS